MRIEKDKEKKLSTSTIDATSSDAARSTPDGRMRQAMDTDNKEASVKVAEDKMIVVEDENLVARLVSNMIRQNEIKRIKKKDDQDLDSEGDEKDITEI